MESIAARTPLWLDGIGGTLPCANAVAAEESSATTTKRAAEPGERMDSKPLGTMLVVAGALIIVIVLLTATGLLNWFGRLPGDIRIERENLNWAPLDQE